MRKLFVFIWNLLNPKQQISYWKSVSFNRIKEGDTIRVNVGFNHFKTEGVVSRKVTGKDNYVWCDVISPTGKYIRSFTASASYGKFEKLIA